MPAHFTRATKLKTVFLRLPAVASLAVLFAFAGISANAQQTYISRYDV